MSNAHISLGSLGNRAHRSNKRNHEIKATMSRVISNISPGFVQAPCAVRERSGAEQGHLPGLHGVHWAVQEHPTAFQGLGGIWG